MEEVYIFLKIVQILHNIYITRFVLRLLLEIGSDPCNKNKKLQTPYAAANDKKTRNTFRRFMEVNPDKFNYQKVCSIIILINIIEYSINIKTDITLLLSNCFNISMYYFLYSLKYLDRLAMR